MDKPYVYTGLGLMPLRDYLEIRASDAGYRSYKEAYDKGWRCFNYEHITPQDLE